jgi:hypothetical protein
LVLKALSRAAGTDGANVFSMPRVQEIEVYARRAAEESVAQIFTFA